MTARLLMPNQISAKKTPSRSPEKGVQERRQALVNRRAQNSERNKQKAKSPVRAQRRSRPTPSHHAINVNPAYERNPGFDHIGNETGGDA